MWGPVKFEISLWGEVYVQSVGDVVCGDENAKIIVHPHKCCIRTRNVQGHLCDSVLMHENLDSVKMVRDVVMQCERYKQYV